MPRVGIEPLRCSSVKHWITSPTHYPWLPHLIINISNGNKNTLSLYNFYQVCMLGISGRNSKVNGHNLALVQRHMSQIFSAFKENMLNVRAYLSSLSVFIFILWGYLFFNVCVRFSNPSFKFFHHFFFIVGFPAKSSCYSTLLREYILLVFTNFLLSCIGALVIHPHRPQDQAYSFF